MNVLVCGAVLAVTLMAALASFSSAHRHVNRLARKADIATLLESRLASMRAVVKGDSPQEFLRKWAVSDNSKFNPILDRDLLVSTLFQSAFGVTPTEVLKFNGSDYTVKYQIEIKKINGLSPYAEVLCIQNCVLGDVSYIRLAATAELSTIGANVVLGGASELFIAL